MYQPREAKKEEEEEEEAAANKQLRREARCKRGSLHDCCFMRSLSVNRKSAERGGGRRKEGKECIRNELNARGVRETRKNEAGRDERRREEWRRGRSV